MHDPTTKIKHYLKPHQYQHKNQYNNNKQYPVLSRVRESGLLEQTAQLGLPSKLEKQGLTLEKAKELLPLLEDLGLLSLVANNQQLLINGLAPVAVEGAPLLLPLVAGALDVGAPRSSSERRDSRAWMRFCLRMAWRFLSLVCPQVPCLDWC